MAEGNTLSGVNVVLVMTYGSLVSTKLHNVSICIFKHVNGILNNNSKSRAMYISLFFV